jgi:hypothetical protein
MCGAFLQGLVSPSHRWLCRRPGEGRPLQYYTRAISIREQYPGPCANSADDGAGPHRALQLHAAPRLDVDGRRGAGAVPVSNQDTLRRRPLRRLGGAPGGQLMAPCPDSSLSPHFGGCECIPPSGRPGFSKPRILGSGIAGPGRIPPCFRAWPQAPLLLSCPICRTNNLEVLDFPMSTAAALGTCSPPACPPGHGSNAPSGRLQPSPR